CVDVVVAEASFVGERLRKDVGLGPHEVLAHVLLLAVVAETTAIKHIAERRSIAAHLIPIAEAGVGAVFRPYVPISTHIPLECVVEDRTGRDEVVVELAAVSVRQW